MLASKRSPEWWALRDDCRAAWHAAIDAGHAGNSALKAAKIREYQALCERLGVPIDTSLGVQPQAGYARESTAVHACESPADIFARRREPASAANQGNVRDSEPERPARAAGPAADVYARRRQEADRVRAASAGGGED